MFMNLKRIQTYQDPEVIAALAKYAREKGISLAEVLRRAAKQMKESPAVVEVLKRKRSKHPLFRLIGIGRGERGASQNVDKIYE